MPASIPSKWFKYLSALKVFIADLWTSPKDRDSTLNLTFFFNSRNIAIYFSSVAFPPSSFSENIYTTLKSELP